MSSIGSELENKFVSFDLESYYRILKNEWLTGFFCGVVCQSIVGFSLWFLFLR